MHIYVLIHPESSLRTTEQTAIPNHLESIVLLISNDELHHYERDRPDPTYVDFCHVESVTFSPHKLSLLLAAASLRRTGSRQPA